MSTTATSTGDAGTATDAAGGATGNETGREAGSAADSDTGSAAGRDTGSETGHEAAAPEDPEALIARERVRIDQLDARIIGLVRDRLEISENIQRVRIESGGRRLHLSREMQILDHYSTELGRTGRDLAMTLLRLCRGQ